MKTRRRFISLLLAALLLCGLLPVEALADASGEGQTYTITASAGDNGSISPSGSVTAGGTDITTGGYNLTAVFDEVTTSASLSPTSASYNKLTATDELSFTLTLPSGVTLTSISVDNNYPLKEGTQYTVTGNVYKISKGELRGFTAGTHSLNFKLSDGSVLSAEITISNGFTVSTGYLDFGSAAVGYTQPAGQSLTITNTSSETITISLDSDDSVSYADFEVTGGTDFSGGTATIAAGGTATVTVRPKADLAAGSY